MTKLKSVLLAAGLAFSFSLGAADSTSVAGPTPDTAYNPVDFNAWMSGFGQTPKINDHIAFNPANPAEWMGWVDPSKHNQMHMNFANPAFYTQFMRPEVFMEFMKPENMMAWMNPETYQVMMNPDTMNYWMTPNAYTHAMNPGMYQASMNPAAYMIFMNPATYASLTTMPTCQNEDKQNMAWPFC